MLTRCLVVDFSLVFACMTRLFYFVALLLVGYDCGFVCRWVGSGWFVDLGLGACCVCVCWLCFNVC